MLAVVAGLGPAACIADPMAPCSAFDAGESADNQIVREFQGPIAAIAMKEAFVLRNLCDEPGEECRVDKLPLPELSAGSQVMLTSAGHYLVGIDREDGDVWTYQFDDAGHRASSQATYIDKNGGPAQLVIGLRDSDTLIVRDGRNRLATYQPTDTMAVPIAPTLGDYVRLAAVGSRHVAVKVPHGEDAQTLYLVDLGPEDAATPTPQPPVKVGSGDFTSIVFGPDDRTLVVSEGRGASASVFVFDVSNANVIDAFEGELISSRQENQHRAIEELPGLHAVSPSGERLAYRTASGALAVRRVGAQTSCLVRNTNRLGTDREPTRNVGEHSVAGFSADGILYAEYNVGAGDSHVYAYAPRQQQLIPLGNGTADWHLSAVPGRVTSPNGDLQHVWAMGVSAGSHATIGEGNVEGRTVGRELTFMPRDDAAVWAIDTADQVIINERSAERALSVRRVDPPRFADGSLRFDQQQTEQVVEHFVADEAAGPMRVPLKGRLCLSTGVPGTWGYRCGNSSGSTSAIATNSGAQEQSDPNMLPEFDPPFPDQGDDNDNDSSDPNRD